MPFNRRKGGLFGFRKSARQPYLDPVQKKKNILDAWILVEHLAEGDLPGGAAHNRSLKNSRDKDYAALFQSELQKTRYRKNARKGIVIRMGIFPFKEVLSILQHKFGLRVSTEEIGRNTDKFSLALYFDESLQLIPEMTFVTISSQIRETENIPNLQDFRKYETEIRESMQTRFAGTAGKAKEFNRQLHSVLDINGGAEQARFDVLENLDSDAADLHSFFIEDLQKAGSWKSPLLDRYLGFETVTHLSLDTRIHSPGFNAALFCDLLQPARYPLGRFPSKVQFSLSLMQQCAVNILIHPELSSMQSVNGPPGTGKTTLLRDIFAHLCVQQALSLIGHFSGGQLQGEILNAPDGTSLLKLPADVTCWSVLCTSTNNGAVQNIVRQMPLQSETDSEFHAALKNANYFPETASHLFENEKEESDRISPEDCKCWGLFSMEGGRSSNMTRLKNTINEVCIQLESETNPGTEGVQEFQKLCSRLYNLLTLKQKIYKTHELQERRRLQKVLMKDLKTEESTLRDLLEQEQHSLEKVQSCMRVMEDVRDVQQMTLLQSEHTIQYCIGQLNEVREAVFHGELDVALLDMYDFQIESQTQIKLDAQNELQNISYSIPKQQKEIAETEDRIRNLHKTLEEKRREILEMENTSWDGLDFSLSYRDLQLSNPWSDSGMRRLQSLLFAASLKVRRDILWQGRAHLKTALKIWNDQELYSQTPGLIRASWEWISLCIPVISTTFASVSRMAEHLGPGAFGTLVVDEAGQALPQAAVGAILRSQRVIMVGDPSQIQPVLTLNSRMMEVLSRHFGIQSEHLSYSSSAQTLCDAASCWGFQELSSEESRPSDLQTDQWTGIPLWVHRRCASPMFDISNAISYGNNMVQGLCREGRAFWYDLPGSAEDKFVQVQADFLAWKLKQMIQENPEIGKDGKEDIVFVISPFKNIADKLASRLSGFFTRYRNGKPVNVGTVHTFQGKEAPIVFLVLGADFKSQGAASWAVSTPNILNVAITRAKDELYIIADKKLYRSLGAVPIQKTLTILDAFEKAHPEIGQACTAELSQFRKETLLSAAGQIQIPLEEDTSAQEEHQAASDSSTGNNLNTIQGTVSYVSREGNKRYAYISGRDGIRYLIPESQYHTLVPADNLDKNDLVLIAWSDAVSQKGKSYRHIHRIEILQQEK